MNWMSPVEDYSLREKPEMCSGVSNKGRNFGASIGLAPERMSFKTIGTAFFIWKMN
jgi:hypothetical protein